MKKNFLTTHDEHLDHYYGKRGTKKREAYEKGFQKFYREAVAEIEREDKLKAKKSRLSSSGTTRNSAHP